MKTFFLFLLLSASVAMAQMKIPNGLLLTNLTGTGHMLAVNSGGTVILTNNTSGGSASISTNANQFGASTVLTLKDGVTTTNPVNQGVLVMMGSINQTTAGTNINAWYASNYFAGLLQIASGSPGAGKVLTSDSAGHATWEVNSGSSLAVPISSVQFNSNGVQQGSSLLIFTNGVLLAQQIDTVSLNVSTLTLTNAMGSNQVRLGYQDLTNVIRRQTIYADAGCMISNSTGGATFSTEETSSPTNRMFDSYIFSGTDTNLVQFKMAMPLNWDLSTIKVKLWTHSTNNIAAQTNVWGISASAIKTTSVITNINWGTELTITNAVSSSGGQAFLSPATPALTVGNSPVAAGNLVWFRIRRLPGHPDDSNGGQMKLLGAWIQYGETMSEVALW